MMGRGDEMVGRGVGRGGRSVEGEEEEEERRRGRGRGRRGAGAGRRRNPTDIINDWCRVVFADQAATRALHLQPWCEKYVTTYHAAPAARRPISAGVIM